MSKELIAKSALLKKYAKESKDFGNRDVDLTKARIVGNNGYVLGQEFTFTGVIDTVPVTDAKGKPTEVFIGLETTSGQWLSLKALMGLSSLRGYQLTGELQDAQGTVHTAQVAEDVDASFVGWADLPSRDLFEVAACIEAGEINMKGRTAIYKGSVFRPFIAKKGGVKDLATGATVKKGDQRAQDAKLWEVA